MLQLTYISTVARPVAPTIVEDVLAASRRNNARSDITGLLLFDGRRFLQMLEGDPLAVRAAYARIGRDTRHKALVCLSERTTEARLFGRWDMAFQGIDPAAPARALIDAVDALTDGVADASSRELFRSFARLKAA